MATSSSPDRPPDGSSIEVAIIGSARIGPEDPRYSDAERLGAALAGEGWTVVTGGYGGLMGAAATGARSVGGHTIGLPMSAWKHLTPHESHTQLRWSADYAERLRHLLAADVVVALPGGLGTLSEASIVWAAAQTEANTPALLLVGTVWTKLAAVFGRELVIDDSDLALAHQMHTIDDVVSAIHDLLNTPRHEGTARG